MAGQFGNERVTVLNLEVVQADAERSLLLVKGAVPGPNGGLVMVSLRRQGARAGLRRKGRLMASIEMRDVAGQEGRVPRDLPAEIFESKVSVPLMHQVVVAGPRRDPRGHALDEDARRGPRRWQEAVAPEGHRSRPSGSIRSPQWVGGGVAHGPTPRDSREMGQQEDAARSAPVRAHRRAAERQARRRGGARLDEPKTKQAVGVLDAFELAGKVLAGASRSDGVRRRREVVPEPADT